MSTLQKNRTLILKTVDVTNCSVKSEESNFSCVQNSVKCESFRDTDENFGNFESKIENFGGFIGKRENLRKETSERKETFGTEILQQNTKFFNIIQASSESTLNSKRAHAKKNFIELFKSLCVLCDICDDPRTQGVIKLNRHERIVAAIILKKSSGFGVNTRKIFPTKIPQQTCGRCFTKILLLYNRHKNKHTRLKNKEETEQIMDQPSHGYHCQCLSCQNQYGALPVLLKGIEEQNKLQGSQMQVNFQPGHSQTLLDLQPPSVTSSVTDQNRENINYQQYLVKYEEGYSSLQSEFQGLYQTPQLNVQSYSQFERPDSQTEMAYQPATKTATYLSQTEVDFNELNDHRQGQFDANFQSQAQYYVPHTHTSNIPDSERSSSVPEQHLPTILQELEDKCQSDVTSQPSTSGTSSQSQAQDDKQSKKIMTCVHCDKSFTHKGDFNKHVRKHTKEKPYKCSFCDKMFSHTSNLHRHQRIHSGAKPFKCQYCDRCFNRKDKLESHKNSKVCKNKRNW